MAEEEESGNSGGCCPCFGRKEKKPLLPREVEVEYHPKYPTLSAEGSISDLSEHQDYDDPVTEQPRTTEMLTGSLGGVVGVSGVSAHSSEYGSVEGSEKGSKRYYRLETSEGVPTEIKKT